MLCFERLGEIVCDLLLLAPRRSHRPTWMRGYASASLLESRQCAAVRTRLGAISEQPQKCAPDAAERTEQSHLKAPGGAFWPPTMRKKSGATSGAAGAAAGDGGSSDGDGGSGSGSGGSGGGGARRREGRRLRGLVALMQRLSQQ